MVPQHLIYCGVKQAGGECPSPSLSPLSQAGGCTIRRLVPLVKCLASQGKYGLAAPLVHYGDDPVMANADSKLVGSVCVKMCPAQVVRLLLST